MANPYHRAPHQGGAGFAAYESTHAALLIDFDNVTMGMRSDLSKELKTLLASDVIKGKVSVQRAYADWRRYPQYIVPLSEASVDLIFAPAYGSNKKNATWYLFADPTVGPAVELDYLSGYEAPQVAMKATDKSGGGSPLLWTHLFWAYAQPAVFGMILPAL